MRFFCLEPEVAGDWGDNIEVDRSVHPPIVTKLQYHFDGWLGDALLESFPCFIVTESAKQRIESARLTGTTFAPVEVTTSECFEELHPNKKLPTFAWLTVHGKRGSDDFGLTSDATLVVSERALGLLRQLGIPNASVSEFRR